MPIWLIWKRGGHNSLGHRDASFAVTGENLVCGDGGCAAGRDSPATRSPNPASLLGSVVRERARLHTEAILEDYREVPFVLECPGDAGPDFPRDDIPKVE